MTETIELIKQNLVVSGVIAVFVVLLILAIIF